MSGGLGQASDAGPLWLGGDCHLIDGPRERAW